MLVHDTFTSARASNVPDSSFARLFSFFFRPGNKPAGRPQILAPSRSGNKPRATANSRSPSALATSRGALRAAMSSSLSSIRVLVAAGRRFRRQRCKQRALQCVCRSKQWTGRIKNTPNVFLQVQSGDLEEHHPTSASPFFADHL